MKRTPKELRREMRRLRAKVLVLELAAERDQVVIGQLELENRSLCAALRLRLPALEQEGDTRTAAFVRDYLAELNDPEGS